MERSLALDAVVVGSRRTGEANRELTLLSPALGLVRATIYGGQKSKKAQRPPLFSFGKFYLERSGRGGFYTLREAALSPRCPFGYDLDQFAIASFVAELAAVLGGPDPKEAYALAVAAFEALEAAAGEAARSAVLIQFVWRLMEVAGLVGDLSSCPVCDRPYASGEFAFYNRSLNFFTCRACADETSLFLGPGARRYLALTSALPFGQALQVPLNEATALRIRKAMCAYAAHVCGYNLHSLGSGMV